MVSWKTAAELNNGRFEIERSFNAKNFEKIGMLEGKGTTNVQTNYHFFDSNPLPGKSYYRLKQVDQIVNNGKNVDGPATYSKVISVTRENTSLVVVSPNPATDVISLDIDSRIQARKWELFDTNGRLRKSGTSFPTIPVEKLGSGEYLIRVTTDTGDVVTRKVYIK